MHGKAIPALLVLLVVGVAWFALKQSSEPTVVGLDGDGTLQHLAADAEKQEQTALDREIGQAESSDSPSSEEQNAAPAVIQRGDFSNQLRVTDAQGNPVAGRVEFIKVDESFLTYFSSLARLGSAIYFDSMVQEGMVNLADGIFNLTAAGNQADFLVVVAPGFTPHLEKWEPLPPGKNFELALIKAKSISVTVLTQDGQPIQDAEVWYRWTGIFNQNENSPLLDRFRTRFFQESVNTDANGLAVLTSTFPEWSTEIFVRPGDLWATVVQTVEAGTSVEIRCPNAFMLKGIVSVAGKAPQTEVQMKVSIRQGDQYWLLESGRAKEEGKYQITGIPSGYPAYQIEAQGNGFANQTKTIFAPKPGEVIELDFAMEQGVGGFIQLTDPWGMPLPNARLKLVAEGKRSSMYGYDSDDAGQVSLPPDFRKNETWLLNLRLGKELYLRLNQPFVVGETTAITVPNLAKISAIEIPQEILADATLEAVRWSGKSSQSWGASWWSPELAQTTLLASGSADLEIQLSDGRKIHQPIVLAPGSEGPVIVDRAPCTLRFALPANIPASVTLSNQDGIVVFAKDEISGPISIPLSQGNYALVVLWPETSREIPLISLDQQEVDLGPIEPLPSGYIEGIVQDSHGVPVQWANVRLTSTNGYNSQSWTTDVDGAFFFYDIPLGKYYLLCDTAQTHGIQGSTLIENIDVTAKQLEQQITLDLVTSENKRVKLSCASHWAFNSFAILASLPASTHAAIGSHGQASISAQSESAWLGVAQILDGEIMAQAMPIAAGPGEFTLPSTTMRTSNIHFIDELGQPWQHLLIRLELNGHPLTRRPTLDASGTLKVQSDSTAPWSLQIASPSGQIFRFDLVALQNDQTLTIPGKIRGREITVRNENGDALPWPTVQVLDDSSTFPSDKNGRVTLPQNLTQALVVSANGYLPCLVRDSSGKTITLPQRLDGIQMHLPDDATKILWTSHSGFESLWKNQAAVGPGHNPIELPPMAAGRFTFYAYNAQAVILAEQEFVLRENGQVLAWEE
ncbi:MAG: carboxypeptidase-like regulatory domain-containing protein [Planctomycetota bacterium]